MSGLRPRRVFGKLRRAVRRRSASRQRGERARYFDLAARHTPYLAVEARGGVYLVSTADENIGRSLFTNQSRKEFARLAKAVRAVEVASGERSGGIFIDVGANIGTTVIPALIEHGFERAVALEPAPTNLLLLSQNLRLNHLEPRVAVLGVAASNAAGVSLLHVDPSRSGLARLVADPDEGTLEVETTTLDLLVRTGQIVADDVGFLWIDVEGHEPMVLSGAATLLRRRIPLVVEVTFDDDLRLEQLVEVLDPHYTHYLDLILDWKERPPLQPLRSLKDLPATTKEYTDLLFVSLPPGR